MLGVRQRPGAVRGGQCGDRRVCARWRRGVSRLLVPGLPELRNGGGAMTKLDEEHALTRETAVEYRKRPLVIELKPRGLVIRVKGTQEAYPVAFEAIFDLARKLAARDLQIAQYRRT